MSTFGSLQIGDTFDYEIDDVEYSFIKTDVVSMMGGENIIRHAYGEPPYINAVCIDDEGTESQYLGYLFFFESHWEVYHVNRKVA
jgi:hypothetical protein